MAKWIGLIILILAGLVLLLRGDAGTIGGLEPAEFAVIASGVALLVYLGLPALQSYSGRMGQGVKDAATWLAFALVLVALYSFRGEFSEIGRRVTGELLPPGSALSVDTERTKEKAVRLRKRPDGHFTARSKVNGASITMLVDTGASAVVLTQTDARSAGIDMASLRYTTPVSTANGTTFAAPIRLRNVSIGSISLSNVEALIAKPGAMRGSLLGMSFLTRLRSYEFSGEFLTLRS